MKTYSILFAEDVPHYGTAVIEAENDSAALEAAKAYDLSEVTSDPAWEYSICKRIVHIEDGDGNDIAHDIPLDGYSPRSESVRDKTLFDAAPELLAAAQLVIERWANGDLADAVRQLDAAVIAATVEG